MIWRQILFAPCVGVCFEIHFSPPLGTILDVRFNILLLFAPSNQTMKHFVVQLQIITFLSWGIVSNQIFYLSSSSSSYTHSISDSYEIILVIHEMTTPRLIDHQLEMDRSYPLLAIVLDVPGPGLALNVDDDTAHRSLKVNRDQGTQIALGVLERIEEAGEAACRIVLDGTDVLHVGGILTFAGHPDRVHAVACGRLLALDKVFQLDGHLLGQSVRLVIVFGDPAVDLVQLQEHTGRALVVIVVVLLDARQPALDVHIAHLSLWRWLVVVAMVNVLTATGRQTRNTIN